VAAVATATLHTGRHRDRTCVKDNTVAGPAQP